VRVKDRTLDGEAAGATPAGAALPDAAPAAARGGRLCEKGRFGLVSLLQAGGPAGGPPALAGGKPVEAAEARARLEALLGQARQPLLRLSPVLAAEVLDRFLAFAAARRIPVEPEGLAGLEPGWASLLRRAAVVGSHPVAISPVAGGEAAVAGRVRRAPAGYRRILIFGGLDRANNVAFTDCLALQRRGQARLWYYGETEVVYERFFERLVPDPALLAEGLAGADGPVEVLVNPEELLACSGKSAEKKVLAALKAAGSEVRITLYWNSRNAAYLLAALDGKGARAEAKHDLLLDAGLGSRLGPGQDANEKAGVRWGLAAGQEAGLRAGQEAGQEPGLRPGLRPGEAELFIRLPRAALLAGLGLPSGRDPLQAGELDKALLQNLLVG
jgi:hypothetical protein